MKRIIVAEDDRAVREFALTVLTRAGYEVATTESVLEGRAIDAPSPFDLVLTDNDCRRPNDGLGWVRELVGRSRILMSGSPVPDLPVGVPFLQKPFKPEALLKAVSETLAKPATSDQCVCPNFPGEYEWCPVHGKSRQGNNENA